MDLSIYFRSITEQDNCSVVICNPEHEIIYMNPAAAVRYAKSGGTGLVGRSIFECHNRESEERIRKVVSWFKEGPKNNRIYTYHNEKENKDVYMIALRDGEGKFIGYYEKHEYRNAEQGKLYQFDRNL